MFCDMKQSAACDKCTKITKPVCGKDDKTYQNECLAQCVNVKIKKHQACPNNSEAMTVWQVFSKASSELVTKWQKNWDADDRTPVYSATTKSTIGATKTLYKFEFPNKCAITIVYDASKGSLEFGSKKCPTDKCADATKLPAAVVSKLKTPPKLATVLVHHTTPRRNTP